MIKRRLHSCRLQHAKHWGGLLKFHRLLSENVCMYIDIIAIRSTQKLLKYLLVTGYCAIKRTILLSILRVLNAITNSAKYSQGGLW